MGAEDVFRILAVVLAVLSMTILIVSKRVKYGWKFWLAIPIAAFIWYWVLVCILMAYYMWNVSGVK